MRDNARDETRQRSTWDRIGWWLLLSTLFGTLAVIGRGLVNSDILTSLPWSARMAHQVGLIAAAVSGASIFGAIAEQRWKIRLEIYLAAAVLVAAMAAFGAAPAVIVSMFLFSSTALGTLGLVWLSGSRTPPLVFVTTFGAAIYCIGFTFLGLFSINTVVLHSFLLIGPSVVALAHPRARRELMASGGALIQATRPPDRRSKAELAGWAAFLFVAVLQLFLSALPERYWDAMVIHLYIPSYVAAHGAWSFDPTLYVWAFWPAGVDWMYVHLFLLNGEPAAQLFNCIALLLVCWTLYSLALRVASREVAIWIAVLFASMPIAFIQSSSLYIENTLMLWITSAVGILVVAELRPDLRHALMILTLLAAASISKLPGAFAALVIGLSLLWFVFRQHPQKNVIILVLSACVLFSAIACFPYIHSWMKTGSPVLSLNNHIFKSPYFLPIKFRDWNYLGHFTWSLLYDFTFASGRFLQAFTGALGLTMILLLPLAFAGLIVRPRANAAAGFGLGLAIALPLAVDMQYLRYLYPFFPLLLFPAAIGISLLFERGPTRLLTVALLVAVTAFNIYKIPSGGWILIDFDLRAGFDRVIRRNLELALVPQRIANQLINKAAGASTRVLYTGEPYGALLQGTALYTDWYNTKLLGEVNALVGPEDVKALFDRWAVTHVVHTNGDRKAAQRMIGAYLTANLRPMAEVGVLKIYDVRSPR